MSTIRNAGEDGVILGKPANSYWYGTEVQGEARQSHPFALLIGSLVGYCNAALLTKHPAHMSDKNL